MAEIKKKILWHLILRHTKASLANRLNTSYLTILSNDARLEKVLLHPGCTLSTLLGLFSDYLTRFMTDSMFIKVVDQLRNPDSYSPNHTFGSRSMVADIGSHTGKKLELIMVSKIIMAGIYTITITIYIVSQQCNYNTPHAHSIQMYHTLQE
jgi:hypothetical protein